MKFDELVRTKLGDGPALERDEATQHAKHDLETILTVVRKINTSLVLSDVLELVTDEAIRLTKAERGFIMLLGTSGTLEFVVGRESTGKTISSDQFQISSSIPMDVFTTGESLYVESALNDERFERRQSVMNLALQTIICSPLMTQEEKVGVLYVDSKSIQDVNQADVLFGFEILAGHAAIAIKNAHLYADVKQTFEKLKQANLHIVHYERMAMKGEMAAEVSHELRNLVSVVLLSLQRLQSKIGTISSEEVSKIIEITIAGVKKIEGFSKSLLTRSRVTARPQPYNLNKIISDFVETMKFLPRFKSNTIRLSLDESLPTSNVDIDQMQQVLLNLMNNIAEERNDATIDIRSEFDGMQGVIRLSIKDNGAGVDEEILPKLFVERVTTKKEGHGYGLTVCRQIIESHGGQIHVESKRDEGALFTITLPVRRE